MAFPVLLDTNVLFGAYLCDTVLRLAEAGTFRPLWSADILTELERNLLLRGIGDERAARRVAHMADAFPDALVEGYEPLIGSMTCDPKDRHVLAAAVRANAELLVTFNLADFPREATGPYDLSVSHPDDFLLDQLDLYPGATVRALRDQAEAYSQPHMTVTDILIRLSRSGVPQFASEVRRHL
ncbi:PIN domain-containing protein [Cellulomonas bogoriensis]|uniref:DNA-binding protein n=1 Tax=Cellulomonas bogoriensis 69B4 = DSM 16987 TaxID=1386082 RepID=A0A0A0C0P7_9CELL|nr:PIN domain-containing protein [Cellulomonas bogoriensis]KGM14213.1 DNA-binding protein [Cellulomonas bogoriensis 69B4 = DSM 16987]